MRSLLYIVILQLKSVPYMKKIFSLIFLFSALMLNARDIVPFEVDSKNNLPTVEIYVNNDPVPFNFILDTGCSVVMAN